MFNSQKNNMYTLKFSPARKMFGHPFFASFPSQLEDLYTGMDLANFVPSVNLAESEKEWHIELSASGFSKEDFKLKLEKDVLTISAEHKTKAAIEGKVYKAREFSLGSFSRTFRIKENSIDEEKVVAVYENGILSVSLLKKASAPESTVKEIRVG